MSQTSTDDLGFDPDELRQRYRDERDKRVRAEANEQYTEIAGEFAHYLEDPYIKFEERAPIIKEVQVAIVGGGFGGMLVAARLHEAGVHDFTVIEKGGDFGGTWYWNRYPGAACDVESYIYLPLLEETGFIPASKYTPAPEILAHCHRIAEHFNLYSRSMLQTEVTDVRWDESSRRWTIRTNRCDEIRARYISMANGPLHRPKLPGIEGVGTFAGHSFHTSRWDYEYTGGTSKGNLTGLKDKVVGIIGTGATAVQVVPKLAEAAKELFVFQRTAACVGVRNNKPTDPEWFKSLKPGWQAERTRNFTQAVTGAQPAVDMIDDEWTKMNWVDTRKLPENDEEALELERIDFENMERVRQRIADVIKDPATAELMMPWYSQSCKRPCFHDEYLPAFNRPNVHLVDTDGKGVNEINERGVIVNGVEYPVDLLIFASGFEVTTGYTHRLGFDPKGRNGVSLSEAWAEGPATLHGVLSNGFPNMFMISTVQGAQATNFVHSITEAAQHVAFLIEQCVKGDIATIEPETAAQDNWFETLFAQLWGIARYNATCTPGYLNSEGGGDMRSARAIAWMTSVLGFAEYVENWRQQGDLAGLTLTPNSK